MKVKVKYSREDSYVLRAILIFLLLLFFAVTIFEFDVALGFKFMHGDERLAMWMGSIMWLSLMVTAWIDVIKRGTVTIVQTQVAIVMAFAVTIVGLISIIGMFVNSFRTFSMWSNAIIFFLSLVAFVGALPGAWRDCAIGEKIIEE